MATTARLRRLQRRLTHVSPAVADSLVAGVLLLAMVAELATKSPEPGQHATNAAAYLLAGAIAAPYLIHRRRPVVALAITSTAVLAYAPGAYVTYPGLSVFALVFGVTMHSDRRRALITAAASAATLAVAVAMQPKNVASASTWITSELAVAVCWLAAANLRNRRTRWRDLEDRAQRVEREREEGTRQAVAAERLRIARELHDVVAHSMSIIAVQSGVGHHVIDTQPTEARRALATIETTSRAALNEMRRLLEVLRQDGETNASLAPSPALTDVPDLVAQLKTSGVDVDLHIKGHRTDVPAGVDLSAFRIVQEALTNVMKHAGTSAQVDITYSNDDVEVVVLDNGGPPHAANGIAPTAHGAEPAAPGHGLIGMRERVTVFGGELSAGPRAAGGFEVRARLPFQAARR